MTLAVIQKWKKLGLVYVPKGDRPWMQTHASVPCADHLFDDVFRIYFATRDLKNRSSIAFVELDIKNPSNILRISTEPVLSPGELGTFDDSGAMPSWVLNYNGKKFLYYIGWNLGVTVPFRNSIGLALSNDDARTFSRIGQGPIFDRTIFEGHFATNPCVLLDKGIWRMWYLSCVKWEFSNGKPKHFYHIKYAESEDGISNWKREGIVCIDFKNESEYAISRPCVLNEEGLYKMWYSYRGDSYRIGYAESFDGIKWERKDDEVSLDVSTSMWDSGMIEYPYVFDHKGKRYMLYNGNSYGETGFGLAVLEV